MSIKSSMQHMKSVSRPLGSLAALVLPALISACSDNVVNVGENGETAAELTTEPSSSCPTGDVVVKNQAELDALEGCTALGGSLTIVPFEGADLRSLHALESVAGLLETSSA